MKVGTGQKEANEELVQRFLASIDEAADGEGAHVDRRRLLLTAIRDGLQQKLDQMKVPLAEKSFDVFLSHGLKYVTAEDLFPSFSLLSTACMDAADREAARRCEEGHPSLLQVVRQGNPEATVSAAVYRRFMLDGEESRRSSSYAWVLSLSDGIDEEVDVLLEVSKGDQVIWHGVGPFTEGMRLKNSGFSPHLTRSLGATFRDVSRWSFEVPLPTASDTLHIRVVLFRRSTGQMLTIISSTEPDYVNSLGGDDANPFRFDIRYSNNSHLRAGDQRLSALIEFHLECAPLQEPNQALNSIAFQSLTEVDFQFIDQFIELHWL